MKLSVLHEEVNREEIHLAFALKHLLGGIEPETVVRVTANNAGIQANTIEDIMVRCKELGISYFGEAGDDVTFDPIIYDGVSLPGEMVKITVPGVWQAHQINCKSCSGSGEEQRGDGVWDNCPACDGYGKVDAHPKILVRAQVS